MSDTKQQTTTGYMLCYGEIQPVEVLRFTDKTVTILWKGRPLRQSRKSTYETFYPTRAEAVAELQRRTKDSLEWAEKVLARAQEKYKRVMEMEP